MSARASTVAAGIAAMLMAACASGPPTPDWQMNARAALERSTAAYLVGDSRIEALEFERARDQIARTGRADLLARAELLRCAAHVASLVLDPCTGFDPLRADAPAAERAYADYLDARVTVQDVAMLPAAHRAVAATLLAAPAGAEPANLLPDPTEPLSRLVAAGVLVRSGRVSPALLQAAVDTASAQGWRRPLLAWLGLQARRADQAGNTDEAVRVRRRIALVEGRS